MSSREEVQRLRRLRAQVDRRLRSYLRPAGYVASGGAAADDAAQNAAPFGAVPAFVPRGAGPEPGALSVSVNLQGGVVFLDDERRVRALAKEIKRLIAEDARRGLSG